MSQSYKLMIDEESPLTNHHSAQLRRQWRRAESSYKRQRRKIQKIVYARSYMIPPSRGFAT